MGKELTPIVKQKIMNRWANDNYSDDYFRPTNFTPSQHIMKLRYGVQHKIDLLKQK